MSLNTEHKVTLTTEQIQLLNNILFDECSYLETCNENEFESYKTIRHKLTTTLYNYFNKIEKAKCKQPTPDWED